MWIVGIVLIVVLGLQIFFKKTLTGKAMQACAISKRAAWLLGIPSERMVLFAFAISAALVAFPVTLAAQAGVVVEQHTTFNIARLTSGDLQQTVSILGTDRAKTVTTGKSKVLIMSVDAGGTEITRLDQDQT